MREVGSAQFIYREVRDWGEFPLGWTFEDTPGVAVDSRDCVYAFTREKNGIVVFNPDGSLLKTWGDDLFKRPHCIFIGPDDTIFCVDDFGHAVYKFTADGEQLMVIETADNPADTGYVWGDQPSAIVRSGPPFNFPTWVALSPEGELYVTDGYGNARVHKFSPEGKLLLSWGKPGGGVGQFETPHSVHVDKDGWVYVADRQNCRIQIFNSEGEYIEQWSDIYWPCDMCADVDGNLYVAEIGGIFMNLEKEADFTSPNARITVRDMSGNIKMEWGEANPTGEGRFFSPHSIAIDSQGNLYVGEVSTSYPGGQAPSDWRAFRKFARV